MSSTGISQVRSAATNVTAKRDRPVTKPTSTPAVAGQNLRRPISGGDFGRRIDDVVQPIVQVATLGPGQVWADAATGLKQLVTLLTILDERSAAGRMARRGEQGRQRRFEPANFRQFVFGGFAKRSPKLRDRFIDRFDTQRVQRPNVGGGQRLFRGRRRVILIR